MGQGPLLHAKFILNSSTTNWLDSVRTLTKTGASLTKSGLTGCLIKAPAMVLKMSIKVNLLRQLPLGPLAMKLNL